jgi:phospholipid-binding lipoprotein MlaA
MNTPRLNNRAGALVVAALALGMMSGCATVPRDKERDPRDPFEPLNRQVFVFNQTVDRVALRPVARAYDEVTPRPVKIGVANFFDNLSTPIWALNHLLQGDLSEAGLQMSRFLINSTGGVGGLMDVAAEGGIPKSRASFDQTFGVWGVPSGPYVMVPFLGPNTFRSGAGAYARFRTDIVWNYFDDQRSVRDKLLVVEIIDTRRRLLPIDSTLERAPDPYIFMRDAYLQRAEFEVRQRRTSPDDDIGLDFEDELWDDDEWEP